MRDGSLSRSLARWLPGYLSSSLPRDAATGRSSSRYDDVAYLLVSLPIALGLANCSINGPFSHWKIHGA